MTTKRTRQVLTFIMALVMMVSCLVTPAAAAASERTGSPAEPLAQSAVTNAESAEGETYTVGPDGEAVAPNEQVEIMVRLDKTPAYLTSGDLQVAAWQSSSLLQAQAKAERNIEKALDTQIDVKENFTLLFNGFSFVGEAWMVDQINQISGVTAFVPVTFELVEPEDEASASMSTSTGMVSATTAWELGYTGKGTVVAVVDTGIRGTHEAFSVMPEGGKIDMEYLENVYAEYGSLMHADSDLDAIYENAKLPFNWDYYDGDAIPNHTASDHGTHVAGIAAGNNGSDFKGVSPDAQIVTMQVFNESGGASFATILSALEDCVYLGVDSINLSLGVVAGWTSYESSGLDDMERVYEALQDAGISIAVAAGNDGTTLTWTNYGNYYSSVYRGLSSNPDVGTVGSPSTLPGSFSVASVVNSEVAGYMNFNGKDYFYSAVAGNPVLGSIPGTYELVYIGLGTTEEIGAAGSLEGKIALVQRGTITFTEKCQNAANAGAAGVLMFNNASGAFSPSVESPIPFGKLTGEEGQEILAGLTDGVYGTVTIYDGFVGQSVSMASSSSWGTTSDLRITPDIAAPGDGITSSVGFYDDNSYETWSGTSMATPHVAAGLNVIKQRVAELFPDATARQINDLGYAFAMSTAHQVNGFVRQQGAGVIDIAAALTTEVYLSVDDNTRPKLELDESEDGTFNFTFYVNNVGDTAHTYTVDVSALTENVYDYDYSGNGWKIQQETTTVKMINGTIYDVTDLCDITGPETVTVAAGETVAVDVSIACTDELMAWFEENCPSGMYLEGFVTLTETGAENPVDLSIPYLGFVGDWDYASILDRGYYWQTATGELNYQQMATSIANYVGYTYEQGLGINPYADMTGKTYLADRNAISPNGDNLYDALNYIEFTLLRNPETVKLYVEDAEGNLITTLYSDKYAMHKDYYVSGWNGGDSFCYIVYDYAANELAEGETAYLVLETWLDHEGYDPADNESGRWVIPFTKDLTAPAVKAVEGGIEVIDENYVAYYAVYADEAKTELLYEEGVFAEERGVASKYESTAEKLYVVTADYAGNEQFYLVENGVVIELDANAFDYGRTIVAQKSIDYATQSYDFEWVSFKSELPGSMTMLTDRAGSNMPDIYNEYGTTIEYMSSAVDTKGTLYSNTLRGVFVVDPETFEATQLFEAEDYRVRNITIRPGTDDLYAQIYGTINGSWSEWFVKLDKETGEYTTLFEFPFNEITPWGVTFINADEICVFDSWFYRFVVYNLNGEVVNTYSSNLTNSRGACEIGVYGYGGNLLYDEVSNAVYVFSDWSWFIADHYGWCGYVKFDFDTQATTLKVVGNAPGSVVYAAFFEEDTYPDVKIPLTDFDLSETAVEMESGASVKVDVIKTPEDANWYNMTWTVEDESVATVSGNRKNVTIYAVNPGTTTITATATDRDTGELVAIKTVEVTVVLDYELQVALNVAGGELEFVSYAPYPFVPASDGDRIYAVSSNAGVSNSESRLVLNQELHMGDTIAFDYFVSSEVDYDYLYFYVNGEEIFRASGEQPWTNYEFVAPCGGEYTLEWVYVKDPATEEGTDNAGVDNVKLIPSQTCYASRFTDVDLNRYYHDAVDYMVANGYMKGVAASAFAPNATLTRGQLVTILYRVAGKPSVDGLENPFTDVAAGKFYTDAVIWAANNGIVKGITSTTFAPEEDVTREQLATILYRYDGKTEADPTVLDAYADGDTVSKFAVNAMAWAVSEGIINGVTTTTLEPAGTATRAQAATMLTRYLVG